jgi:excisionase family DNA binding protein
MSTSTKKLSKKITEIAPRLLSVPEAAIYLSKTVPALRQMIYRGEVPTVRFGRSIRIDIEDLNRLIERHKALENTF